MAAKLRGLAALAALWFLLAGCAGSPPRKASGTPPRDLVREKFEAYSGAIREAFELGFTEAASDPDYVDLQGDAILGYTLSQFYAPFAGARRLLDLEEKHPGHPLLSLLMTKGLEGRYFPFQDSDEFLAGNFPNAYEKTLFDPFYRVALRGYLMAGRPEGAAFERYSLALKEAVRLTPRYADYYPLDPSPETLKAFQLYLDKYPEGPLSDRFRFYMMLPGRLSAWGAAPAQAEAQLSDLKAKTKDELLAMEIQDTLNADFFSPGKAFFWSLALPGTGQVLNGDVQGGVLMAGLSGAAWWWALSRLAAAQTAPDDATRRSALGDAAWGIPLVLFAHGFSASTASSQARFLNLTIEWDILAKQRLTP
jgi:hypothetical protein